MKLSTTLLCMLLGLSSFGWGSDKRAATPNKKAKITMAQAEQVALAKEAGSIREKELEQEKGRLIYSFDIQTKGEAKEKQKKSAKPHK